MELTFYHVRSPELGYGHMGVGLATAMARQGVTVYDEISDHLTNVVAWATITPHPRGWWEGQVPILFTMFEATHLPPPLVENLDEFDTVVVPSRQNVELYGQYHPNVKYVPLGIDPARWSYVKRGEPQRRFNFLVSGHGLRKGMDLAFEAFKRCFPEGSWGKGPIPHLIIKTPTQERFREKRVEFVNGYIQPEAERALYAKAHCFVAPARGEGFGLQPLQAMAQGCPTILTNAHGHEAFAHLGLGISAPTMSPAGTFVYGDGGQWWEPDLDELCGRMLWVYRNYARAAKDARVSASVVAEQFTWERSVDAFLDAIGRTRLTPYEGQPKAWHDVSRKLYKMVLNRDQAADVGGYRQTFIRGAEYSVTPDVKRVYFDQGLLDMRGGSDGLALEQVAQLYGRSVITSS